MGGVEWTGVNHQPYLETEYTGVNHQPCLETEWIYNDLDDLNLLKGDLSCPPGVQLFGEQSIGTLPYSDKDEKKLKKRKIDKDYRQRVKEKKQKLSLEVGELDIKNDQLKGEIVSYQQEIDLMMKDLQKKADERGELKASIDKLKHDVAKGKEFVNRLCREPSIQKDVLECPEQLQVGLLKNVHAVLDENCNWEYQRKVLEEKIANLESDNKMLQVKRQALRERIHKTRTF